MSVVGLKSHPLVRFVEPGVIIVADSRFSYDPPTRPPKDDGQKVAALSDFFISGFSGDVQVAHSALNKLAALKLRPRVVASKATDLLVKSMKQEAAKPTREPPGATEVLLAVRYDSSDIRLYHLASDLGFVPKRVESTKVIGDDAAVKEFDEVLRQQFEDMLWAWGLRALGPRAFKPGTDQRYEDLRDAPAEPNDVYDVPWHEALNTATSGMVEVLSNTKLTSIGGKVQARSITSRGISKITILMSKDDGSTWEKVSLEP